MTLKLSVVVCTYNRVQLLTDALDSICNQTLDKSHYEIIVVDNNSTDNTHEVVDEFCRRFTNVRYCFEPQQGLSYARNRGWREARGEYVAYLDDDARASRSWLEMALELFERVKPSPMCLGGPILPFYSTEKPVWFKDAGRSWGDAPIFLPRGESFSGSNMLWRKEALEAFGGFPVEIGVKGAYLSVGEETMLFKKIWQLSDQPTFYCSPELVVHHWVDPSKMTVFYQLKRAFAGGQVSSLFLDCKTYGSRVRFFGGALLDIARMVPRLLRQRKAHTYVQNWLIEDWGRIFAKLGALSGALGLTIRLRQRS